MTKKTLKKTVAVLALILLVSVLVSVCGVSALAEEAEPFRYEHDPRLNPAAMKDIVVDPTAVYGFAPSPEGSLKQYAELDWSDPELVNGKDGRLARIAYHEEIKSLYTMLDELRAEGKPIEEIARIISAKRNEIRFASYENNPEGLEKLKARNLEKYGHEEGPTPDEVYAKTGSWEGVIASAFNTNPGMDACLGLYDDYYELYIALDYIIRESEQKASREYAVAAFADAAKLEADENAAEALAAFSDAEAVKGWYASEIQAAVSKGVLTGFEDGTLRPDDTINRVQAFVILSRCLPELEATGEAIAFEDVPEWAKDELDRLSAAGLVLGYGDGRLGADDLLTVEQVNIIVARLAA
jgi:hypothetical protein